MLDIAIIDTTYSIKYRGQHHLINCNLEDQPINKSRDLTKSKHSDFAGPVKQEDLDTYKYEDKWLQFAKE